MRVFTGRSRLSTWFQPPADPVDIPTIAITEATTARGLTRSVILGARRYTIPAGLLMVLHQGGEALVPVIMGLAIDRAVATSDAGQLVLWVILLGVNFAVLSLAYRFGSRIGLTGMQAVQHRLRGMVAGRLLDPDDPESAGRLPGVALSIATSDVARLSSAVAIGVYPAGEFAAVLLGGGILLAASPSLGLAVLIGAPLLVLLLDRAGAPLRKRSGREQSLAAGTAGRAADLMAGYRVLKGLNAEDEATRRYRTDSQAALAGTLRARTSRGVYVGTMELLTGIFLVAIAVAAGLQAVSGSLSIGELITVVGLTQFLIGPIGAFAVNFGTVWSTSVASAERVLTVLRATPVSVRPTADWVPHQPQALELDRVRLPGTTPITERIEPGEFVVVHTDGPSANALVNALALRMPPIGGEIRYGTVRIHEADPDEVRASILVAPHAADLFDGTVHDNIALPGSSAASRAAALSAARCDEVLHTLPDGERTAVGEGGLRLSGGQRQRIALARALAQQPPLLVLHDPTTAVDSVTEAAIAARLRPLRSGRTTIVVSRSPALAAIADRVIDCEDER